MLHVFVGGNRSIFFELPFGEAPFGEALLTTLDVMTLTPCRLCTKVSKGASGKAHTTQAVVTT
jgi:hypothetical protein